MAGSIVMMMHGDSLRGQPPACRRASRRHGGGAGGPGQLNEPMRRGLLKFIQMKKALPTMLASGTKPQ